MFYINEIKVDGEPLDIYPETGLDFNAQVNSIGSVSTRQASYSPSYSVPKTPKNVRILGGLGLTGDTSRIPYQKPSCTLDIEGFSFIVQGWLNVKSTDDEYKIYIYSGIINFFKAIENKSLGDMDLSEIDHIKSVANVIASFSNPNYKYLMADYGGKTHDINGRPNIDHMVPSVSVLYLLGKIQSTFGYVFEGQIFSNPDLTNLWLTYPKAIEVDVENQLIAGQGSRFVGYINTPNAGDQFRQWLMPNFYNSRSYSVPSTGNYKIKVRAKSYAPINPSNAFVKYYFSVNEEQVPLIDRVNVVQLGQGLMNSDTEMVYQIALQAGDVISFYDHLRLNGQLDWTVEYWVEIYEIEKGVGSFTDELKDFSISDFMREIMVRFCLTPFTDEHSNKIRFKTMAERVTDAPVVNWSDKYVRRTDESYAYESYAIRNKFQYQYNDKESTYNDGDIMVDNTNLTAEKVVFKSKTYSPERLLSNYLLGGSNRLLPVMKIYDKEIRDNNGVQEIKYKGLEKRFHFVKMEQLDVFPLGWVVSETLMTSGRTAKYPLAVWDGQDWLSLIHKYYKDFGKILNDSRIHEIDLWLNEMDLLTLDLGALYYFEQEQQFYILDKLKYKSGKMSTGTFVRVKPDEISNSTAPVDPTGAVVLVAWMDGTTAPITGTAQQVEMKIVSITASPTNPIVQRWWERWVPQNNAWVNTGNGADPVSLMIMAGDQKFRLGVRCQDNAVYYSNELEYTATSQVCTRYTARAYGNSGDYLQVNFIDCNGQPQQMDVDVPAQMTNYHLTLSFCAIAGSVTQNMGWLIEEGLC